MELLILGAAGESMGTAVGTSFVLLVSFIALLLVLSYYVWKPVKKIMDDREQLIHDDIDSAEQRKAEAERLKAENDALLKQTQAEISELMENAKGQAKKEQEAIITDAQTRATQMIQEAKVDIEREKEQAVRDINDQVAELSVLIAEKMIVKELNVEDQKGLVSKYLQEAGDK
ncbi:F0F1 ATP synthase subunit B [Jeotgalicoccus huakuii]|uniref:F0F1 ATP synthase subunit B n=1 Tax=Jeotgalicoccus TaxID=227979 RepID=UPI0003FD2C13|nr:MULTISPECIES: F0F1 ATP synthase subunit B [Jeotgalicoccus]MCK1975853.1 F0F1 ATP synthase subunit B [Jeotgalicoccus huakuii]QQD84862.1 F0F1 ATP synthase subunit B [Jeotgalicoccus sp. ATCC 8456]